LQEQPLDWPGGEAAPKIEMPPELQGSGVQVAVLLDGAPLEPLLCPATSGLDLGWVRELVEAGGGSGGAGAVVAGLRRTGTAAAQLLVKRGPAPGAAAAASASTPAGGAQGAPAAAEGGSTGAAGQAGAAGGARAPRRLAAPAGGADSDAASGPRAVAPPWARKPAASSKVARAGGGTAAAAGPIKANGIPLSQECHYDEGAPGDQNGGRGGSGGRSRAPVMRRIAPTLVAPPPHAAQPAAAAKAAPATAPATAPTPPAAAPRARGADGGKPAGRAAAGEGRDARTTVEEIAARPEQPCPPGVPRLSGRGWGSFHADCKSEVTKGPIDLAEWWPSARVGFVTSAKSTDKDGRTKTGIKRAHLFGEVWAAGARRAPRRLGGRARA
jgi:hypothetical protein